MKSLIVYDSQFGNTELIAQAIAGVLAEHGDVRLVRVDDATIDDLVGIDFLAMGGPTQAHRASPRMRDFLEMLPVQTLDGMPALAFDTRFRAAEFLSGAASAAISKRLIKAGCSLLMPHESFFVTGTGGPLAEGEFDRATAWTRAAYHKIEVPEPITNWA